MTFLDPLLATHPMLATSLQAAWFWGDQPLRAALETSIRSLVRRTPDLLPVLKTTLHSYKPPRHAWLDGSSELAGLLLTLWALSDAPLRSDVEQMIRAYARRHPGFGADFTTLAQAALDDRRVVNSVADQGKAATRLRALVAQLVEIG